MRPGQHTSERLRTLCPECNERLLLEKPSYGLVTRCGKCSTIQHLLRCSSDDCKFLRLFCETCRAVQAKQQQAKLPDGSKAPSAKKSVPFMKCWPTVGMVICVVIAVVLWVHFPQTRKDSSVQSLLKSLRENYPSQRNETWYHFLGVLEKEPPTVKSITFLHGADNRTAKCLTNELVSLFSGNKDLRTEEVMFSGDGFKGKDYGLALEHYRAKVKSSRVFVADLSEVSGSIARMFHSLCDEVSSDLKPSLFVFALKYNKRKEYLKPMEVATEVLKKAWQDLPGSELFPLLSRVIKNVVDIVPEAKPPC